MKRFALVLAAAVLGTGCIVTHNDTPAPGGGGGAGIGTVNVYWEFVRTKLDASFSQVLYDPFDGNVAPGTGPCSTSGVDFVLIEGLGANVRVDCRLQGVQGVQLPGLDAGTYRVTVSGWRGPNELYTADADLTVQSGREVSQVVQLFGIPSSFQVDLAFLTADGRAAFAGCADARVSRIAYSLVDFAGTLVAQGNVPCVDSATVPPGFSLVGNLALERDDYAIRLQGISAASTVDFDTNATAVTCNDQTFGHYGTDVGQFAWPVDAYDVRTAPTLCR